MEILPETQIVVAMVIFVGYTILGATGLGASPITIAPEMDLGVHDAHHVSPYSSTVGFSPSDRSIAIESILCGLVPHLTQASITCYDIRTHDQEGATMATDWTRREVLTALVRHRSHRPAGDSASAGRSHADGRREVAPNPCDRLAPPARLR
jgi:hypothetical protein